MDVDELTALSERYRTSVAEAEQLETLPSPESRPYEQHYAARAVLQGAAAEMPEDDADATELALLRCRLGINHYLTEENSEGEKLLVAGLSALEGKEAWAALTAAWAAEELAEDQDPDLDQAQAQALAVPVGSTVYAYATMVAHSYNFLGVLWSHRAEGAGTASRYLGRARAVFLARFDSETEGKVPSNQAEEVHTNTLFFLAQTAGALGRQEEMSDLCLATLYRQKRLGQTFEPVKWVRDVVALSSRFAVLTGETRVAGHLVSAAERGLSSLAATDNPAHEGAKTAGAEADVEADVEADAEADAVDDLARTTAETARAKGILYREILLKAGLAHMANVEAGVEAGAEASALPGAWGDPKAQLALDTLRHRVDDAWEADQVPPTVQSIKGFAEARGVFKTALASYEAAKTYFKLEGFVTDHIALLRGQSELYKSLARFETEPKRIAAMASRRDALLGSLLDLLNADVYLVEHQELSFELGEAAQDALSASLTRANDASGASGASTTVAVGDVVRINEAALKVVKYCSHFAKMFELAEEKDRKSNQEASTEEHIVPYLRCHLWIAHAYSKMVPPDQSAKSQVMLLLESAKFFRKTTDLAKARLDPQSTAFAVELEICKDMAELLPAQADQFRYAALKAK